MVAVTVSSTVIDSTGNWISESAPADRALSSASRNNPIASASPSPSAGRGIPFRHQTPSMLAGTAPRIPVTPAAAQTLSQLLHT
jgi:hypothetical protein